MTRLADLAVRRTRALLAACLVAFVALGAYGAGALNELRLPQFADPGSESRKTSERLRDAAGHAAEPGFAVLVRGGASATRAVAGALRSDPGIGQVRAPVTRGGEALVVGHLRKLDEDAAKPVVERLRERLPEAAREAGGSATVGGQAVAYVTVAERVESDLPKAELIVFPVLALLLVVVFRGLLAALLPLTLGAVAVVGALAGLRAFNELVPVSVTAANLVTALGLGLAVDYSLFLVSRFREELSGGAEPPDALRTTMQTAGRTVIFSSVTVAAALLALCLFPQRFLYSMGLGGAFVSLFAAAGALVAIPGMLALLGRRVEAKRPPRADNRWRRAAAGVQRRPLIGAAASVAVLLALAAPALGLKTTTVDSSVLKAEDAARVVDRAVAERFPEVPAQPVLVAAHPDDAARTARAIAGLPGTARVAPPQRLDDGTALLVVAQRAAALSQAGTDHVAAIRDAAPDAGVTGQAAALVDFRASVGDRVPLVLAALALVTALTLFVMTGSVLLSLQAVVVNLLSVAAALGVLVLVFQDGRFEGLLDFTSQGAVEMGAMLLVCAVAFGLSTDYGVFLLARMKELRDSGVPDREAVAEAVGRTSGLISAAAALLCVAMGALLITTLVFLKEMGLATVVAVAVDATLVRVVLVPALMTLGGRWTWWAPARLRRLHARIAPAHG